MFSSIYRTKKDPPTSDEPVLTGPTIHNRKLTYDNEGIFVARPPPLDAPAAAAPSSPEGIPPHRPSSPHDDELSFQACDAADDIPSLEECLRRAGLPGPDDTDDLSDYGVDELPEGGHDEPPLWLETPLSDIDAIPVENVEGDTYLGEPQVQPIKSYEESWTTHEASTTKPFRPFVYHSPPSHSRHGSISSEPPMPDFVPSESKKRKAVETTLLPQHDAQAPLFRKTAPVTKFTQSDNHDDMPAFDAMLQVTEALLKRDLESCKGTDTKVPTTSPAVVGPTIARPRVKSSSPKWMVLPVLGAVFFMPLLQACWRTTSAAWKPYVPVPEPAQAVVLEEELLPHPTIQRSQGSQWITTVLNISHWGEEQSEPVEEEQETQWDVSTTHTTTDELSRQVKATYDDVVNTLTLWVGLAVFLGSFLTFGSTKTTPAKVSPSKKVSSSKYKGDIYKIVRSCDLHLKRNGRKCRRPSLLESYEKYTLAKYQCLSIDDLKIILDLFGVKKQGGNKAELIVKVAEAFEEALLDVTKMEIEQLLKWKGVPCSMRLKKCELIRLAIEDGF